MSRCLFLGRFRKFMSIWQFDDSCVVSLLVLKMLQISEIKYSFMKILAYSLRRCWERGVFENVAISISFYSKWSWVKMLSLWKLASHQNLTLWAIEAMGGWEDVVKTSHCWVLVTPGLKSESGINDCISKLSLTLFIIYQKSKHLLSVF